MSGRAERQTSVGVIIDGKWNMWVRYGSREDGSNKLLAYERDVLLCVFKCSPLDVV